MLAFFIRLLHRRRAANSFREIGLEVFFVTRLFFKDSAYPGPICLSPQDVVLFDFSLAFQ